MTFIWRMFDSRMIKFNFNLDLLISCRTLQLDYLDLYLIHWPLSSQPGKFSFPIDVADLLPFDVKGVWESMEESLKLGLTKAIGVSNFSVKKLENLLSVATVLPAVNQVIHQLSLSFD